MFFSSRKKKSDNENKTTKKKPQTQLLQMVTISRQMEMLFFKIIYRGWAQF